MHCSKLGRWDVTNNTTVSVEVAHLRWILSSSHPIRPHSQSWPPPAQPAPSSELMRPSGRGLGGPAARCWRPSWPSGGGQGSPWVRILGPDCPHRAPTSGCALSAPCPHWGGTAARPVQRARAQLTKENNVTTHRSGGGVSAANTLTSSPLIQFNNFSISALRLDANVFEMSIEISFQAKHNTLVASWKIPDIVAKS